MDHCMLQDHELASSNYVVPLPPRCCEGLFRKRLASVPPNNLRSVEFVGVRERSKFQAETGQTPLIQILEFLLRKALYVGVFHRAEMTEDHRAEMTEAGRSEKGQGRRGCEPRGPPTLDAWPPQHPTLREKSICNISEALTSWIINRCRPLRLPGVAKMGRGSGDKQARGEPFPLKLSVEGRSGVGLHGTRRQRRGPAPSLCFGLHDCHGSEIFTF